VITPVNDESQAPVIAAYLTAAKCETNDKLSNENERELVEADELRSKWWKEMLVIYPALLSQMLTFTCYEVFGDYVHQNPGQSLDGGIADDKLWQDYWRRLTVSHSLTYDAPSGVVGRRSIDMLAVILEGIISRKWDAERFMVL
jgi:hypothetical protein